MENRQGKPKLLLHICCGGCGAYVGGELKSRFDTTLFYSNSNIFPEEEFNARQQEVERVAQELGLPYVLEPYQHKEWLEKVKGLEAEPEKGKRCYVCYLERLSRTASYAQAHGFEYFATTLTVSPHKIARWVFEAGQQLAREKGLHFLEEDFKKQDGFKKACAVSREFNIRRQDYCGCEFSRK